MKVSQHTQVRIGAINTLLKEIGVRDRRFYSSTQDRETNEGQTFSQFYTKEGELYFFSARDKLPEIKCRKGFSDKVSNGGTLQGQLEQFREFILTGKHIRLFSQHWGYKFESLVVLHETGVYLGILKDSDFYWVNYAPDGKNRYWKDGGEVFQ